jgi:recombination protein RecT
MSNTLRNRAQGNEVAKTEEPNTLAGQIRKMESQFQLAMPKGAEASQLVRDALTALRTTPKLAECDPASVLGALMTCSQLGLRPGVLGHAWVLPFYDSRSRGQKAQLVIGYQGLVELAHRSGKVASLIARTVYTNDTFEIAYGLEDKLVHIPPRRGDRGEPEGYYAVLHLNTGGHAYIYMTKAEVEQHRDQFAMAKKRDGTIVGPWRDNFESMAHKTCVLKLAKWMPKSTDLATAMVVDEGVRVDLAPSHDAATTTHHFGNHDDDTIDGEVLTEADVLRDNIQAEADSTGLTPEQLDADFAEANGGILLADANVEQLQSYLERIREQAA